MNRPFSFHRKNARIALDARRGRRNLDELDHRQVEMFSHLTEMELEELADIGTPQVTR